MTDPEGLDLLNELEALEEADPRDLGNDQVSLLRKLFETREEGMGLFLFARVIFGYKDLTTALHLPICRLLSKWGETHFTDGHITRAPISGILEDEHGEIAESYRRLMVIIPRECFKTSLCTRANVLWQLACDPLHNYTFGIFNEKAENAQAWVYSISQVVERSRLFQTLWPEMLPRGISFVDQDRGLTKRRDIKWGAGGILFERDSIGTPELSIEPHGIGGAVTGKHYTHMVLDDIIGKEAAYSPAVMQTAIDWVDNQRPLERPANGGCELVACTPWAHNDTYTHKLTKWPGEYRVYRRHILENELGEPDTVSGESIFPEKISTRAAKKLLKTDWFVNHAQFQCLPLPSRDQAFQIEWVKYAQVLEHHNSEPVLKISPEHYSPEILDLECGDESAPQAVPLSWLAKAILLDPAPSKPNEIKKEPRAANGIVVIGKDPWGRRFLLETRSIKDTPNRVFEALYELSEKWGTDLIGVEEVNFSAVYAPLFQELAQYKWPDWKPQFMPLKTAGREKFSRIRQSLIPPMENGFWIFNTHGTAKAVREMIEFGLAGSEVDVLDALSYTDESIQRPETPDEIHRNYYTQHREATSRGLTGYGQFFRGELH